MHISIKPITGFDLSKLLSNNRETAAVKPPSFEEGAEQNTCAA